MKTALMVAVIIIGLIGAGALAMAATDSINPKDGYWIAGIAAVIVALYVWKGNKIK